MYLHASASPSTYTDNVEAGRWRRGWSVRLARPVAGGEEGLKASAAVVEQVEGQIEGMGVKVERLTQGEMQQKKAEIGEGGLESRGYGKEKPYNNSRKATKGRREEIQEKRYTTAGTDVVSISGTIYLIDHSADSELQANLDEGGDGFGIREKFSRDKLTKDDIRRILRNVAGDSGYSETRVRQMLQDIGITSKHMSDIDLSAELKMAAGTNVSLDSTTRRQGEAPRHDRGGFDGSENRKSLGQKTRLTTTDGRITLGFTHDGKIYLDVDNLDADTPIHEYTHLWDAAVAHANPELWRRGVELMKQTELWGRVERSRGYGQK